MLSSATGLLIPTCFLLVLAAVAITLQKKWRQQKVELTEGKPYWRVRGETITQILFLLMQGFVVGSIVSILYLLFLPVGFSQLKVVVPTCAEAFVFFLLVVIAAVFLLALFSIPPFRALGIRNNQSKFLRGASLVLELSGTVIVIVAIATIMVTITIQSQALGQAKAYTKIPDATRLSLLASGSGAPETEGTSTSSLNTLVEQAQAAQALMVSLDVNQEISFNESDLAGFDHFVIVNKTYLDAIGVGLGTAGSSGTLQKLPSSEVPSLVANQTAIWQAKNSTQQPSFYRYQGSGLPILGQNPGKGGQSVICKNPLVLVVDDLTYKWNYDGFVLPLLSSGNIFFSNYQSAEQLVTSSGASDLVASIDNMEELALQAAQNLTTIIQILWFSAAVALGIVIVISFQVAAAWSVVATRQIFAQRCLGRSLLSIATDALARRVIISGAASCIGFAIEVLILRNAVITSLGVALAIFVIAVLCQLAFRCYLAARVFHKVAIRR